jgi:hypothetical protein
MQMILLWWQKKRWMKLDWYKEYWISTTKTIDYAIDSLWEENGVSKIRLKNIGMIPMPIDVRLTFKDSSTESHYVPMSLMFGAKPIEGGDKTGRTILNGDGRVLHTSLNQPGS